MSSEQEYEPFKGLTDEEIASLTTEQVEREVKLCMAHEGVQFPEEPGNPPKQPEAAKTEYYEINGWLFANESDAQHIADIVNASGRLEQPYSKSWDRMATVASCESDVVVSRTKLYSPDVYARIQLQLEAYKGEKKAFDERQSAYRKALQASAACADRVHSAHTRAVKKRQEERWRQIKFTEYLELADGDQQMALRFMRKAGVCSATWTPQGDVEVEEVLTEELAEVSADDGLSI